MSTLTASSLQDGVAHLEAASEASDVDLEPLLRRFLVSIAELAGAQAGAVRVLTDDGRHMRLVAQLGLPAHVQEAERLVDRSCGMCGAAVGADVLAWVTDLRSCDRQGGDTISAGNARVCWPFRCVTGIRRWASTTCFLSPRSRSRSRRRPSCG